MHQLSLHSTIGQLEDGALLGDGVVVVEDSEGRLVLLQLGTGAPLSASAKRLEAAGHRHNLCVLQVVRGDTDRFTHRIPFLACPSQWNPHSGPSLAWGRVGPGDLGPRPILGLTCGQWTGEPTGPGVTNCTPARRQAGPAHAGGGGCPGCQWW